MKNTTKSTLLLVAFSVSALAQQHPSSPGSSAALGGTKEIEPLRNVTNPGQPTTQQRITPAGVQTVLDGRIYSVAFGADSSEIWLLRDVANCCARAYNGDLIRLNWKQNQVLERLPVGGTPGIQGLAWHHAKNRLLATVIAPGKDSLTKGAVSVYEAGRDGLTKVASGFGTAFAGAPAASLHRLIVPLTAEDQLAVLNADGTLEGKVRVGISPFASVIDDAGNVAWVSNWGGRIPKSGELSAPLGEGPDRVVVDTRGIPASGTVQRIDLNTRRVTNTIETGLHPTALAWDQKRSRLYVANTNSDSITVIDTAANRAIRTVPLDFFDGPAFGIAPTALALSPDGERLWVACGGINAVAQFRTRERLQIEGLIPTAYYPLTLAVSSDGRYLLAGTFFGVGEGAGKKANERSPGFARFTAHVIPVPEPDQLASYTLAVSENNHLTLKGAVIPKVSGAGKQEPLPVPRTPQNASLIQHVVYIIKENWNYDSFFGADPRGNGDPSLQLFGSDVIPNHRKLSEEFALFDNFYSTGYSSQDGQAWMTQANSTEYLILPGYIGRGGDVMYGEDPLTFSKAGFLWNPVMAAGRTVRIYGEFTAAPKKQHPDWTYAELMHRWQTGQEFSGEFHVTPYDKAVAPITSPEYPGFYFDVPDVIRAQIFLRDLAAWNEQGNMPNLIVLELPLDHTLGSRPGYPTPKAMVATNDLALGQIVEGLTKSKFWPHMAIFVAEDDGFNGLDHVDGRRVVALAISPYTQRGVVDSTFYSQTSMVKTMELMLGVQPLTLFDRIATDMRNAFTRVPDLTPYQAEIPQQSLSEENPKASALNGKAREGAIASAHMDFSKPDAAPMGKLNRILWHNIRGWNTAYPPDHRAVFLPADAGDGNDDDDEQPIAVQHKAKRLHNHDQK